MPAHLCLDDARWVDLDTEPDNLPENGELVAILVKEIETNERDLYGVRLAVYQDMNDRPWLKPHANNQLSSDYNPIHVQAWVPISMPADRFTRQSQVVWEPSHG